MGKIIKVDLERDSISDLTMDEILRLKEIIATSLQIARKNAKKKKPIQGLLFDTVATNPEIETTFEKSNAGIWAVFEKELLEVEQMGVDIKHYYQSVLNWSLKKKGIKRTSRGWIATTQDFMRSDKQKNKLVMVDNLPKEAENSEAMLKYLNM